MGRSLTKIILFFPQIASANALEPLKNSNIIDLVLKGNPLCDRIRDPSAYVRYAFRNFTTLMPIMFYFHFFQAYG